MLSQNLDDKFIEKAFYLIDYLSSIQFSIWYYLKFKCPFLVSIKFTVYLIRKFKCPLLASIKFTVYLIRKIPLLDTKLIHKQFNSSSNILWFEVIVAYAWLPINRP